MDEKQWICNRDTNPSIVDVYNHEIAEGYHWHIYPHLGMIIIKGSWEAILPCYGQIEF